VIAPARGPPWDDTPVELKPDYDPLAQPEPEMECYQRSAWLRISRQQAQQTTVCIPVLPFWITRDFLSNGTFAPFLDDCRPGEPLGAVARSLSPVVLSQ